MQLSTNARWTKSYATARRMPNTVSAMESASPLDEINDMDEIEEDLEDDCDSDEDCECAECTEERRESAEGFAALTTWQKVCTSPTTWLLETRLGWTAQAVAVVVLMVAAFVYGSYR